MVTILWRIRFLSHYWRLPRRAVSRFLRHFPNAANKGPDHRKYDVWMVASLKDAWRLEAEPDHQPDGTLNSAAARRLIKIPLGSVMKSNLDLAIGVLVHAADA
jgi:hypothetical protein